MFVRQSSSTGSCQQPLSLFSETFLFFGGSVTKQSTGTISLEIMTLVRVGTSLSYCRDATLINCCIARSREMQLTSKEFVVVLALVLPIWFANHLWISSGSFTRFIRENWEFPQHDELSTPAFRVIMDHNASRRLSLVYEKIYAPATLVLDSDGARTIFWLTLTLLVNVICTTVEWQLLQE